MINVLLFIGNAVLFFLWLRTLNGKRCPNCGQRNKA